MPPVHDLHERERCTLEFWYWPTEQLVHTLPVKRLPFPQPHTLAPEEEVMPLGQLLHAALVCELLFWYLPPGQLKHRR